MKPFVFFVPFVATFSVRFVAYGTPWQISTMQID